MYQKLKLQALPGMVGAKMSNTVILARTNMEKLPDSCGKCDYYGQPTALSEFQSCKIVRRKLVRSFFENARPDWCPLVEAVRAAGEPKEREG